MAKVVKPTSNAEAQALDADEQTNAQAQLDAQSNYLPQNPAHGAALLSPPDETEQPTYEVPTWAEFRQYVMDNGDKYVRASYPAAPTDLIDTVWCGIPVVEHGQARVMTPKREWLVY